MAVSLETARMSDGPTHGLHQYFNPCKSTESINDDPGRKRRKRQRTNSPERQDGKPSNDEWYKQLRAAADTPAPRKTVAHALCEMSPGSVLSVEPRDIKPLMPEKRADTCTSPAEQPETKGDASRTPPRKMLKIRSDGKLSSPKQQIPDPNIKPGRRRAVSRSVTGEKTRLVVIKYGTNGGNRCKLGQKINDIFAGSTIVLRKNRPSPKLSLENHVKMSKPAIPLKQTHPFFLAKSNQCTNVGEDKSKSESKDGNTVAATSRKASPRKVTSVNKIIRRTSSAGVAGMADRPIGFAFDRIPRFSGATEAPWPPEGMTHLKPVMDVIKIPQDEVVTSSPGCRVRKLKNPTVLVPKAEEVLQPFDRLVHLERVGRDHGNLPAHHSRKPIRRVTNGLELQQRVLKNLSSYSSEDKTYQASFQEKPHNFVHSALHHLYQRIPETTTAFDRFECENHEWVHKYAPATTEDILQSGPESAILRDWLRNLTISAVEDRGLEATRTRKSSIGSGRAGHPFKRKRRKRNGELEGFVISSDEETDQMSEIMTGQSSQLEEHGQNLDKRSLLRTCDATRKPNDLERSANAVVISGPHGCGKTAAVFAVAQELGFEIFEINSGSRRSGKDILDKVGDMSKNHLVNRSNEEPNKETIDDADDMLRATDCLKKDLESGRQGTMKSFFQPQINQKKQDKTTAKPRGRPAKKKVSDNKLSRLPPKAQKQSLILLEEVDVLFEDDRQFWSTTLELILRSRRPVIMTCVDESLLPLDDMFLFAILRLSPPPISLAADYLLLLACNEGHLLSREPVSALYKVKGRDLRASIAELNCLCQIGIGDSKGGLEWLLIGSSSKNSEDGKSKKLRVVSDGTYPQGLGWISSGFSPYKNDGDLEAESELLAEVWHGWGLDLAEFDGFLPLNEAHDNAKYTQEANLSKLQVLDGIYDGLSTADICSPLGLRCNDTTVLDPTQPDINDEIRSDYMEGAVLLQADPRMDQTDMSTSLAIGMRVLARRLAPHYTALTTSSIIQQLPALLEKAQEPPPINTAETRKAVAALSAANALTSLTVPSSVLATDIAPYIRSIVAYDLRLEDYRRKLDDVLSSSLVGSGDTRNVKRMRTTRASRAALEGGAKATTRRERWFPNDLNLSAVARTGGATWGEVALNTMEATGVGSDDKVV